MRGFIGTKTETGDFRDISSSSPVLTWAGTIGGASRIRVSRYADGFIAQALIRPGSTAHAAALATGIPAEWRATPGSGDFRRGPLVGIASGAGAWGCDIDENGELRLYKYNGAAADAGTNYFVTTWTYF